MNPPKAIEILELNVKKAGKKMPPDTLEALKLGIEALKRIQSRRDLNTGWELTPLPGETDDPDPP